MILNSIIKLPIKLTHKILRVFGVYVTRTEKHAFQELGFILFDNIVKSSKSGVLHIGAHMGQEAEFYNSAKTKVIWVEAIPDVYRQLEINIKRFKNQYAYNYLLGKKNQSKVNFFVSSNQSVSSSIYKLGNEHGWKGVEMTSQISLRMFRLDEVFTKNKLKSYQNWVIDVQGAELDVLIGAGTLLNLCQTLLIEVSTRETYEKGSKYLDVRKKLVDCGLTPLWEPLEGSHENVLFVRTKN
jgi:FkbM family methyltransferase